MATNTMVALSCFKLRIFSIFCNQPKLGWSWWANQSPLPMVTIWQPNCVTIGIIISDVSFWLSPSHHTSGSVWERLKFLLGDCSFNLNVGSQTFSKSWTKMTELHHGFSLFSNMYLGLWDTDIKVMGFTGKKKAVTSFNTCCIVRYNLICLWLITSSMNQLQWILVVDWALKTFYHFKFDKTVY